MKYLIFLLLPIFAACATQPSASEIQKIEVVKKISVPAELLIPCAPILVAEAPSLDELLQENLVVVEMYGTCKLRHYKLIGAIKEVTQ
jgi:hypothetical protein